MAKESKTRAKIAVLVSGGGTNLQALIDAQASEIITSGVLSLVVSNNPQAYAIDRAQNAGIETKIINKAELGAEAFETELIDVLEQHDIDLIILAGFMCILSKRFCEKFANRIINVHPSLIPSFCGEGFYGLHVHEAALSYGVKVTGATVHFVNEIPDGGAIIAQKAVEVLPDDTPDVLQKRVMEQAEWILLPRAAEMVSAQLMKGAN
jgi:phosphoribosylglycinamide formyltransferase 1